LTVALIDGYSLSDASQARGIGTFLKHLVAGLAGQPELTVKVLAEPGVELPVGAARVTIHRPVRPRVRSLTHDLLLPADLRRGPRDVFHSPAQHPPRSSPVPWIQTLHDLTPLTWPDPVLARERRRWLHVGPRLRRAVTVATVSRFSADQAIHHLGLDPQRLEVIPLGVDPAVFHPRHGPDVDSPYLLHVAAWGPHKGFGEAMAVIARLADQGLPHRLVLAGPQNRWMQSWIEATVRAAPRPDRVEVAGFVQDLPRAYRGATALLMTSRCEGFGLPALEAMACGTPVVAFDNSSLPEVVGDAGLLVPDGDIEAMTRAVRGLVDSPARREEHAAAGVARAAEFRWGDTVAAYCQLLESAAS
jgi:glycosyltransferase involved in cell wall biosynthesis